MQTQYTLPADASAMPLLPNGNGAFRIGWNITLRRGTSVEICGQFNAKLAEVRFENRLYLLAVETNSSAESMSAQGRAPISPVVPRGRKDWTVRWRRFVLSRLEGNGARELRE